MISADNLKGMRISLASPEQIRSWSWGEVTKPETVNYRSLKPERDGLFCERIFGPTKDFECYCGKYKKIRYKGVICDRCGVEITKSKVRRERMGHIELAAPVAHVWFVKGAPSRIGLLLDLSPRSLERVLFFAQYIITQVDEKGKEEAIQRVKEEIQEEIAQKEEMTRAKIGELKESLTGEGAGQESLAIKEEIDRLEQQLIEEPARAQKEAEERIDALEDLYPLKLLTESKYVELKRKYAHIFQAGIGAEAILSILSSLDLEKLRHTLRQEIDSASGQRRKKAIKRLHVVEAFLRSSNKPEWMIMNVLPVLPPDLRPMVQLDGRRFATSDLNDLYRRVINRNNRLRRLLSLDAPEMIIHNEKRMLQEAVDSLIDNGRQKRATSGAGNRPLKSRSDVLRGKQGRFRQNLLGKRVDYSGRSVIIVGPELKLHQCGLPRRMALELFKPFVMSRLVQQGLAANIKSARRMVERAKPEIWDILEEVVKERPILLNRAPTLHRLSIQAFEPVLIDSSAIQLHPLVCTAFNADFDGDQMAVHVPLSKAAVREAREIMLSSHNILLPSSGEPIIAPTLDMVLGCYYLTFAKAGATGEGMLFRSFEDAELAYNLDIIELSAEIEINNSDTGGPIRTTVGRIIFNSALPEDYGFINEVIDKSGLKRIILKCIKLCGSEKAAIIADNIKQLGFRYATKSGVTISASDIKTPAAKAGVLKKADEIVSQIEDQYYRGLITDEERYNSIVQLWNDTTNEITDIVSQSLDRQGGVYMMATSGAKGNISQIRQMAGMRGLMIDPSGKILEFPIRSGFHEGLSVMEYFISSHGARKGLADTALRTSDAGYLTRRLVDVAQDVIVREEDCGTTLGVWIVDSKDSFLPPFLDRITGRLVATKIVHPDNGQVIVERNQEITDEKARQVISAGITQVHVRSPLSCQARHGICQQCYGIDLARGELVNNNVAVGIIAAQSIGEPGTQLTLRTFHTGGVVGLDITTGLPRVEELFEARIPKGQTILSEIDGTAEVINTEEGYRIRISNSEFYRNEYPLPSDSELLVSDDEWVDIGTVLAKRISPEGVEEEAAAISPAPPIIAPVAGKVNIEEGKLLISYEEREEVEYAVPAIATLRVESGTKVRAGDQLTEGHVNPQDILRIKGREAVQRYLIDEVQKVYRSQGVDINDKHIETIVCRMLQKVRVDSPGDTELLPGEIVDRYVFEDTNTKIVASGGEPATAQTALLGITKAALNSNSFLAAASFQETTKVLTEAVISGKTDMLLGLKENVIIGRLIPARALLEEPPEEDDKHELEEGQAEESIESQLQLTS